MSAKERLHELVDEMTGAEAEQALQVITYRRGRTVKAPGAIVLDDAHARRLLDALDAPEAFEPGLRRLADRPRALGG